MTIGFNDVFGGGGGAPKVWASGMTVAQYDYVVSPADKEVYQRITATGGGTTDPADDVTNYAARSYTRTVALQTPTNLQNQAAGDYYFANGATKTNPSLPASTRTKVLGLSGRGEVQFLGMLGGSSATTYTAKLS